MQVRRVKFDQTTLQGIYPTIVIVIVGLEQTLNNTTFWHGTNVVPTGQDQRREEQPADHAQIEVSITQSRVSRVQLAWDLSSSIAEGAVESEAGK